MNHRESLTAVYIQSTHYHIHVGIKNAFPCSVSPQPAVISSSDCHMDPSNRVQSLLSTQAIAASRIFWCQCGNSTELGECMKETIRYYSCSLGVVKLYVNMRSCRPGLSQIYVGLVSLALSMRQNRKHNQMMKTFVGLSIQECPSQDTKGRCAFLNKETFSRTSSGRS